MKLPQKVLHYLGQFLSKITPRQSHKLSKLGYKIIM
jgi:hypothetical protein